MDKTELANRFATRKPGRTHNAYTDGNAYVLYDSPIAVWHGDTVQFYWHGFYTATTTSHMNAILRALGGYPPVSTSVAKRTNQEIFVWKRQ